MQGNKTHEQQVKILERKDDSHRKDTADEAGAPAAYGSTPAPSHNQESRDHNKHNNPGQSGHGPQKHNPAEEKQS
jgi:hypothetical protein